MNVDFQPVQQSLLVNTKVGDIVMCEEEYSSEGLASWQKDITVSLNRLSRNPISAAMAERASSTVESRAERN
ncbi:hypothetical protein CR513_13581, partial [Mucuna pruriens]